MLAMSDAHKAAPVLACRGVRLGPSVGPAVLSWKAVAQSAIGAGAGAAAGQALNAVTQGTAFAAETAQGINGYARAAALGGATSALSQVIRGQWSWREVAASAVGSAAGAAAGQAMNGALGNVSWGAAASPVLSRFAGGLAAGWASEQVKSIDPNYTAARLSTMYAGVLGNALGESLAQADWDGGNAHEQAAQVNSAAQQQAFRQSEIQQQNAGASTENVAQAQAFLALNPVASADRYEGVTDLKGRTSGIFTTDLGTASWRILGNSSVDPGSMESLKGSDGVYRVTISGTNENLPEPAQQAALASGHGPLTVEAATDWISRSRAEDQAYYNNMIADATNPIDAIGGIFGRAFDNAFYDVSSGVVGLYGLATDSDARARLGGAVIDAASHPVDTSVNLYRAGAGYLRDTSGEQIAEDVVRFGAGGFATAGAGKLATGVGGMALRSFGRAAAVEAGAVGLEVLDELATLGPNTQRVVVAYQSAYNDAAKALSTKGLPVPKGLNPRTWEGGQIDGFARAEMNAWKQVNGVDDLVINRRLGTNGGIKGYRIPDLFLPSERTVLDGTIGVKGLTTPQIQDFFNSGHVDRVILISPNQKPTVITIDQYRLFKK